MVDTVVDFTSCPTGNTFDRLTDDGAHPYTRMWSTIHRKYDQMSFEGVPLAELSDSEFLSYTQRALGLGFDHQDTHYEADALRKKVTLWTSRGWARYEEKRQGKVKIARKVALIAGFACLGPVMGAFGGVAATAGEVVAETCSDL
jgi:hypothetical protein